MESASSTHNDPFGDPITSAQTTKVATLLVGRNASLTLGTDSLIVLDSKTTRAIPFHNILWAELTDFEINIRYARSRSKTLVRAASIIYPIEKTERQRAASWVSNLLNYAYGDSQRRKRIKVLINPVSGKGTHSIARCEIDVERTQFQGHGVEIAQKLDIAAYDVIAVCSGDGLSHEVFNGLGKKRNAMRALSSIAVVQFPCGSANALSWNLNGTDSNSIAALEVVKGIRTPLDLVSITQGDRRTLSFLSQSFGIVAECDLDTDHLRWMGSARFTWGFLVRLLGETVYPCDIAVKVDISSKAQIREHVRKELKHETPLESDSQAESSSSSSSKPSLSIEEDDDGLPPLQYGT
ncbi:sphinganine kinase lcb4, partial [Peltigera leucophlebia]|nr:sphinganine kinase lcb4 [Peltigera leucophlebia]